MGVGLKPADEGVKISEIMTNSAAAKAGLKVNDCVLSIAGKSVETVDNEWLQEDGSWREKGELRRRYYEVTTVADGHVVVFRDLTRGGWFKQRA